MTDAKADTSAMHCSVGLPGQIDAFEFARRGRTQAGVFSVHRLQRLLDGLADQPSVELVALNEAPSEPGLVRFVLVGQLNASGRPQLVLQVQTKLLLECQRCLGPMVLSIDRQTAFDLVRREADLGEESFDEDHPDEPEKLVGSRQFDVLDLIEDELILEVPYVPRHEQCPDLVETVSDDAVEDEAPARPSPFAVLEQLKTKR